MNAIQKAYERLHRLETDEIVDYAYNLEQENEELKHKLERQTKDYQRILQEQQADIDNLERNCDVYNEQMNDAVERTIELQHKLNETRKYIKENGDIEPIEWQEENENKNLAPRKMMAYASREAELLFNILQIIDKEQKK